MSNAKERLKKLEGLIDKLKVISSSRKTEEEREEEEDDDDRRFSMKSREEQLVEMREAKEKLLEMLKEKETKIAELSKLHATYAAVEAAEAKTEKNGSISQDEDEQDDTNDEPEEKHSSPSDLLWSQMKRQLNMRESMRNKKKELEDLIRNENSAPLNDQIRTEFSGDQIINGYKDFLKVSSILYYT